MNYRHAFHAGNFADVVKHAVFVRVLMHLRDKPAPFRIIDTHAGAGRYDLAGPEAGRSGEWRNGIGRLVGAKLPPPAAALLAPYLEAVAACNTDAQLKTYPGSPALACALMRRQDRLVACEFEPNAAAALTRELRGDNRGKVVAIDGWTALEAYVPPNEHRGIVLIDPPFEQADDFSRLVHGLAAAHRKWPTGVYLLWYPIKDAAAVAAFVRKIKRLGLAKTLQAELVVKAETATTGLRGSGLVVVNPPWKLMDELAILLPALAAVLAEPDAPPPTWHWLTGER